MLPVGGSMMSRIVAGVVMLALATIAAAADSPRVGVYTVHAESVTLHTTLPGRVVAYRTAEIRPQVDGIIRKRLFKAGAHVDAGQKLYKIDATKYRAAIAKAKAALAEAKAGVQSAKPKAERARRLFQSNAVSQEKRDSAEAALAEARASVASARADLQTARTNLDYSDITAPIAGRIGTSNITVGGLATANQAEALTTIHKIQPIYVDIQQSQTQYARLKQALASGRLKKLDDDTARIRIRVGGSKTATLPGRLTFTSAEVNSNTGSVRLRAEVTNDDKALLPGMYVRAELVRGVDANAILVPQQAVERGPDGRPYCFVLGPDDHVQRRQLELAGTVKARWRVSDGLEAGERVVVQGLGKISADRKIAAIAVEPNAAGTFVAVGDTKNGDDESTGQSAG